MVYKNDQTKGFLGMQLRHLCTIIFFSTISCSPNYAAAFLEDDHPPHYLLTDSTFSVGHNSSHSSTESLDEPFSSSSSPHPLATPSAQQWTVEETAVWISEVAANKKVWPKFFALLSTLPSPPPSVSTKEYPYLKWYSPATPQGATLKTGRYVSHHITHAGLIQKIINDGTLLQAMKEAKDKVFLPLIKKLSSPTD
jgi:hypothetical protein